MILYNITVIIEDGIEQEWLRWINQDFIPRALSSNLLVSSRLLKVIDSPNEGITYCLQFIADTLANYDEFIAIYASDLLDSHSQNFKNRSVFFSSAMEFIN